MYAVFIRPKDVYGSSAVPEDFSFNCFSCFVLVLRFSTSVCVCVNMFPLHHRIGKETEKRQGVHALYILSLRSMEDGSFVTHLLIY